MRRMLTVALICALVCAGGCVDRKLMIRSEPPGAEVFVDEAKKGTTGPDGMLTVDFSFYGTREVRVGPLRDVVRNEQGEVVNDPLMYHEMTRVVNVDAPWYGKFPIDFFAEVLWPFTIQDHRYVEFRLEPAATAEELTPQENARRASRLKEEAQEVLGRASLYREEALHPAAPPIR